MKRVLVCGGRTYDDRDMLNRTLLELAPDVVIQGGAFGADRMAQEWAAANSVPFVTYPANWKLGRKAGPIRNEFMLRDSRPDLVVAFPGGRGTADMVGRAKEAGIRVIEIGG